MAMTYEHFESMYTLYDIELQRPVLTNICIRNAMAGPEALKLSRAFNMRHSSMFVKNGLDPEYVSMYRYENIVEAVSGSSFTDDIPFHIDTYYYDTKISELLEEFYIRNPEVIADLFESSTEDIEEMYDIFGMDYNLKG